MNKKYEFFKDLHQDLKYKFKENQKSILELEKNIRVIFQMI